MTTCGEAGLRISQATSRTSGVPLSHGEEVAI
jgi:hypothetical protein